MSFYQQLLLFMTNLAPKRGQRLGKPSIYLIIIEEYGRLLKTIDFLTYLFNQPYRRRIGQFVMQQ